MLVRFVTLAVTAFLLLQKVPESACQERAMADTASSVDDVNRLEGDLGQDAKFVIPFKCNRGYTMAKIAEDYILGTSYFNSKHPTVPNGAYKGDTNCWKSLPVLCHSYNPVTNPRPCYNPAPSGGVMPDAFYRGWGGDAAITPAIPGFLLMSIGMGDWFCQFNFGAGWRWAQHHTGQWVNGMDNSNFCNSVSGYPPWPTTGTLTGGWGFWSFFNLAVPVDINKRFWVAINGQPANCWNSSP